MNFEDQFGVDVARKRLFANPFTDEFVENEVSFYNLPQQYSKDRVMVKMVQPQGQLDDYLNRNWRITDLLVPALYVDGKIWMSLTFMEIQSAFVPITMAAGVVGTAGLGLGYFPLRAASSPEVEEVHVYELNPRVIRFFKDTFRGRPEMEKITIHEGDVRKEALYNKRKKGPSFDFFFMDVYRTLLPDEVISDIHLFQEEGSIEDYRFWGEERVILDSFMNSERPNASMVDRIFIKTWQDTPFNPEDEDEGTMDQYYREMTDEEYRQNTLGPLGLLR